MQKSRGTEVEGYDDVTVQHSVNADLPQSAILMTSSPLLAWARARRISEERNKEQRNEQKQQTGRLLNDGVGLVRPLRRRCSCGCDSTPSPTRYKLSPVDHVVSKPEVEITRSRDSAATSQCDGQSENAAGVRRERGSKTSHVKPAIEMNRQQVLQVYVLNDSSDVRGHVTRAPANRRARSAAALSESSRRNISNAARRIMTSDSTNPDVPGFYRNVTSDVVPSFNGRTGQRHLATTSDEQARSLTRSADELHRPMFTVRSMSYHDKHSTKLSSPKITSLHQSCDKCPPYVCTASMDRKRADCSAYVQKSLYKKPSIIYSSSDCDVTQQPAGSTASLDRGNFQCFRKNWNRRLDGRSRDNKEGRKERRFTEKNDKMMLKTVDDVEFDVDKPTSVCVGTTSSAARGRTARRQGDVSVTTAGVDGVVDRRRMSTVETGHALVDCDFRRGHQRQSTSLERDGGLIVWHPCRLSDKNNDWVCSSGTRRRDRRLVKESAADDVDLMNSKWIKRQIHLPVSRRMRLVSTEDTSRLQRKTSSDTRHSGQSDRSLVSSDHSLVSSRTDPDNVCFSQRSSACRLLPTSTRTGLAYSTQTDPTVRVEFTRDINGNLLRVYNTLPCSIVLSSSGHFNCLTGGACARAVARKPRDAAAVLFDLKFADNINYKLNNYHASKARLQSSKHTGTKQNLSQKSNSRSLKVTCFGVS